MLDKQCVFNAWREDEDYQEPARQLGIKIVNRANNRDGVVALPRGGRHQKIDGEIGDVRTAIVEEHPAFTRAAESSDRSEIAG